MIEKLCRQYTDLRECDIRRIKEISRFLDAFCELTGADIFIDCFLKGEERAVVVAHGKPKQDSLYSSNITGEIVLPQNEPIVFYARQTGSAIRDLKGLTQENKVAMQRTVPIKNDEGSVIGVLIEERDMTSTINKNKRLEELGRETEQLAGMLLDINGNQNVITNHISDGIITFNENMVATYANPGARKVYMELGYELDIVGLTFEDLTFSSLMDKEAILSRKLASQEIGVGEKNLILKYKIRQSSGKLGLVMLMEDVSALKRKEQELIQKSIMVQEMHHRIKNNLQTISSILSIQARRSTCGETKKALQENISRISSISAIHEILSNAQEETINVKQLIEKLLLDIRNYAITEEQNIEIRVTAEEVMVASDKAQPIAIAMNELITNAIRHGYCRKREGTVDVTLTRGSFYHTVTVEDDGDGFAPEKQEKHSLGLDLVRMMVEDDLKGSLRMESGPAGTKIGFDFRA